MTKLSSLSGFVAVGALVVLAGSAATATAIGAGPGHSGHPGGPGGGPASHTPVNERSLASLARSANLAIGVAVSTDYLADSAEYKAIVDREFSSITAENVMKWEALEPEQGVYTYEKADGLIAYAHRTHKAVRGHTLVWHNQNPAWVNETDLSKAELRAVLKKHVIETARHFRGKVYEWDVLNEAFEEDGTLRDTIWLRALGPDYIADVFRWAKIGDPKAKLFYNDYNLEWIGPKSDAAYAKLKALRAQGVPIDGIGFQGHLGAQYGFDTGVYTNFQRFAALGLQISVTEADVRYVLPGDNYKVQAQVQGYHSLLQPCLLVAACHSFTIWGVSDLNSWIPGVFPDQGEALLWDENYKPKPAYTGVQFDLALAGGHPLHRPAVKPLP
jgi:endo-1,4-beta-xylanase